MQKHFFILLFPLLFVCTSNIAQRGKDGNITINSNTIVNEFTTATSDINTGDTQFTVADATLNSNNRFNSSLSTGDLLLIIQMQGVSINASAEPWTGNGIYGLPLSPQWGEITNYNNCGNYEYMEVKSVNNNTITTRCAIQKNYTNTGKIQIVRIPRYHSLTINDTIKTQQWDGTTGGITAIETDSNLHIGTNGAIDAHGTGFRGGIADFSSSIYGSGDYASIYNSNAGMRGEGIAGFGNEYTPFGGQYGKGAAANAGGGGCGHNAGGGGGANGGDINNWLDGAGVPDALYNTAWGLETPSIAGIISDGGGKGGYTYSSNNENANTTAPGNTNWGSDNRRNQGGYGGRPLDYSNGKIFLGGGGGAGDVNGATNTGGSGGNGGGLILIKTYGNITGTGTIVANGNNGEDLTSNNPPAFDYGGNDGAGGGGAGGTILIQNTPSASISNLNIIAQGGNGGNQTLVRGLLYINLIFEAEGPGGGGGGGYISVPSYNNSSTTNTQGGTNGITNSDALTEFPPNGATSGHNGITALSDSIINLIATNDTICVGENANFIASTNVALPNNYNIIWYDTELNMLATGTTFTTGTIQNDTSFLVGICPGNELIKIQAIIGASFSLDTTNLNLIHEHCNKNDGSITGLNIVGGALPLTYYWNNTLTTNIDTTNLQSGNYQLTVTDNNGCSAPLGTFTIQNIAAPTIDTTNIIITPDTCHQSTGAINNILITNGSAPFTYFWNTLANDSLNINTLQSGNYQLLVIDNFGCKDSIVITVPNIGTTPIADFTIPYNTYPTNESIAIANNSSSNVVSWNYSYNNEISNLPSPSISFAEEGNYTICLEVKNTYNCLADTCKNILIVTPNTQLIIPNVLTPNNDGANDIFTILGLQENDALTIYNRWGKIIFEASPYQNNWNGENKQGKIISDGTYYYVVTRKDKETITGFFNVIK